MLNIYIDGASRGNPGKSGIGIIFKFDNTLVSVYREYIGIKTNNQAEYMALKRALKIAQSFQNKVITIFSDSELLIKQRKNLYKIRNKSLKLINREIHNLEKVFDKINYVQIPRSNNFEADHLANLAIDEYIRKNKQDNSGGNEESELR